MNTPVEIEPRKPLTKKQRAELALRQNGLCGCLCGEKLDHARDGVIDEHVIPLALGGSNDLSNRQLWRKPCAMEKTKADVRSIAKSKRMGGEHGQQARRKKENYRPMPSRGFYKTVTRGFDGKVRKREK